MSKGRCLYCKQVFEKKGDAHMFCCRLCGERHRKGVDTKCSYNDGVQCAKMEKEKKKEKPTPKKCVCGAEAITVKTRFGKMVTCPNPMSCSHNLRTAWKKSEDAAIVEWNTLISSVAEKRKARR